MFYFPQVHHWKSGDIIVSDYTIVHTLVFFSCMYFFNRLLLQTILVLIVFFLYSMIERLRIIKQILENNKVINNKITFYFRTLLGIIHIYIFL